MEFERLEYLIGNEKLNCLKQKNILVLGVGGVGSSVVNALVRSGIGNITLVDYDKVDITNINRQLEAFHSTLDTYKTEALKRIVLDINPNCNVKVINELIDKNNMSLLFQDKYDFVIDCCDTMDTKKLVIKSCLDNKINFITSMGTANKFDASKLEITTLEKTFNDPIARIMRKYAKDERLPLNKIKVLSSKEVPIKGSKLGSNSFVPPSAGILIANYVFLELIKE